VFTRVYLKAACIDTQLHNSNEVKFNFKSDKFNFKEFLPNTGKNMIHLEFVINHHMTLKHDLTVRGNFYQSTDVIVYNEKISSTKLFQK
jgi:hypothetical protein